MLSLFLQIFLSFFVKYFTPFLRVLLYELITLFFKTSEQVVFPPFRVKFKGRLWTTMKAREELGIILAILGFGKGGSKKFNNAADEPAGWPDEHSFEAFEHPSYTSRKVANEIIEALFTHYGMDPYTHPFTMEEPATPTKKKKRARALSNQENTVAVDDPNDNSVQEEEDAEEEPVVKKRKLGEYEMIREKNIAEREEMARNLGIMPHKNEFSCTTRQMSNQKKRYLMHI